MIPIHQTRFGMPNGNCTLACIASVFEVPLDQVPDPGPQDDDSAEGVARWWAPLIEWMRLRGVYPITFRDTGYRPTGWHLMGGKGPRGIGHSVVGRDGAMVHDPHPGGGGLVELEDYTLLAALDPARFGGGKP